MSRRLGEAIMRLPGLLNDTSTAGRIPMPIKATLRDDNTLELPEDAPRLAQPNTPLSVIDLGGGTFVVTETDPQVPSLAEQFRAGLEESGISEEKLLSNLEETKREIAEEGPEDDSQ
jgi:hypothetical protein